MILEEAIQLEFTYAAGETASRFLVALRDDKKVLGLRCQKCERVFCPPRASCPDCCVACEEMVEVGPMGKLVSWTEVPGKGVMGLVKFEGADTAMLHRILSAVSELEVGCAMELHFADERSASILDIEGFETQGGAST